MAASLLARGVSALSGLALALPPVLAQEGPDSLSPCSDLGPDPPILKSPPDGATLHTFQPVLEAEPSNPPLGLAGYTFTITGTDDSLIASSPLVPDPRWTVPEGVLHDGREYKWFATVHDQHGCQASSTRRRFTLDVQRLGAPDYFASQNVVLGAEATASVNIATGNLVLSQTDASSPGIEPPVILSRTYNSRGAGKLPYVDDAVPYRAVQAGTWSWDASRKWSGSASHKESVAAGIHQHYFYGAQARLFVPPGATLVTYAYLDPGALPRELMLQFWVGDGSGWEHRAYWGKNLIGWGTNGTNSRRRIGNLPQAGQWVRLEVPASQVGLEGKTVAGMAYTLYDGQAWFDKSYLGGGSVGYGWTFGVDLVSPRVSYARLIDRSAAGYLDLVDTNGDSHFFYPTEDGTTYVSKSGEFATVTRIPQPCTLPPDLCDDPGDWLVQDANRFRFQFDKSTGDLKTTWLPERDDGAGFTYTYQGGRLTSIRDRLGRQVSFEYDSEGRLLRVKADFDSGRVLATYEYDAHDQLRAATDPLGNRTEYTYDPVTHDLLTITTPRGVQSSTVGDFQTAFTYQAALAGEEHRRVAEVRRPHTEGGSTTNLVTSFSYTPGSKTSKVTLPKGTATPSDPNDFVTTYEYNDRGNPTRITDASGNATTMAWNSENLVTSVTDREGATIQYSYDGNGNLCEERLPVNNRAGQPAVTKWLYEDLWVPPELRQPYVCSTSTKPIHNLPTKVVDAEGNTTTYDYYSPNAGQPWVTAITAGAGTAEAATTTFTYYTNSAEPWRYSKLKTKRMPKGNASGCEATCAASYTVTYEYWGPGATYSFPGDTSMANMLQEGQLKSTAQPGDTPVTCAGSPATTCRHYDRYGSEIHLLDAKGDHYGRYDASGRLVKQQSIGTTGNPDPSRWVQFSYDADGNQIRVIDPDITGDLTAHGYDDLNRLTSVTDAWGTTTSYSYDANGNVTAQATAGIGTVSSTYDGLDRLATLTDPDGRVTTYAAYDQEGRLLEKRLPNSTHVHYRYNPAGWLTALENRQGATHSTGEGVIADYAYTYDGTGKKLTEARPDGQITYRYDSVGRLWEVSQGTSTRRYVYDQNSNRVEVTTNGSLTKGYTYNALDQLLEIRDSSGNVTDSFTYNSAGETELHSGSGFTRTYTYDAHGQAIREEQGGASFSYVLDGLNRVIQETERNANGSVISDLRFGYGPGDSRLYEKDAASGALTVSYVADSDGLLGAREGTSTIYYYFSGRGDVVQKADHGGVLSHPSPLAYDEFGVPLASGGVPFGFTGLWQRDTSSLTATVRMGTRLYSPSLGRFLSKDPVEGGSLNDYEYAGQDPCNNLDLDGNTWWRVGSGFACREVTRFLRWSGSFAIRARPAVRTPVRFSFDVRPRFHFGLRVRTGGFGWTQVVYRPYLGQRGAIITIRMGLLDARSLVIPCFFWEVWVWDERGILG